MRKLILYCLLVFTGVSAFSQQKILPAVRASASPSIDGDISELAWQNAPVATNFIQANPSFGVPATTRTEVKVLYDNSAIYIAAHIFDDPSQIRTQLTARDGEQRQDVDYFAVFFDTYNDQQNGFQFLVTTANVQSDAKLNPNSSWTYGEFGDRTWDAIWQSKVTITNDGWTVEMKIPYISLRFPKKDVQTWGIQFLQYSRRKNEAAYWSPSNPNLNGYINQFGKLENLVDIKPPLRLSFSPYVSGGVRMVPEQSGTRTEWLRSGGMDVKYGINESFTLDATLIPDFGQVVSDNIINNLSPFEIQFQENRQFFTEGTELFNKAGLFYSRRVGAIPSRYYQVQNLGANSHYEIVENPSITQLYNTIKFSGRNKQKLGIGIFNAVTAPMHATLRNTNTGKDSIVETEPLTNYSIFVIDQALKNRSSITFTNTNVMRSGEARDANVSSLDWSLYTSNNMYQLRGTARYSNIFGYTPFNGNLNLIDDTVRRGSLMVRPYDGTSGTLRFGKVSGKFQFYGQSGFESNTYDPNDLGFLQNPNKVVHQGNISYNQLTATDKLLMYRYSLGLTTNYLYKGYKFSEVLVNASAFWWFKNFWDVTLSVNSYPSTQNDFFDLRTPGYVLRKPAEVTFGLNGSTDSRKRLYFSYSLYYASRSVADNRYNQVDLSLRYRFSNRFSLSTRWLKQFEENQRGFAFAREANGDPIVGFRNYTDYQTIVSGIYSFTPRLNLTLRTRQYVNYIDYQSFYNTTKDGRLTPRNFLNGANDVYNIFNVDAFLTWDFRLGSRLILGWKNWVGDPYAVVSQKGYFDNLGQILRTDHANELTMRFIYFIDYNQLRRKN